CKLRAEDAADVMQDVFQALAAHLPNFRLAKASDSFRGWLWTITRNKIRDHYRSAQVHGAAVGGADIQQRIASVPEPDFSSETASLEVRRLVQRALDQIRGDFSETTWRAFQLAVFEGRNATEI